MKFGLLKERKIPQDRRVVLTPSILVKLKKTYPEADVIIESSDLRVFTDEEYTRLGFKVVDDIAVCDVLIGVKEVPVEALIPNKKYFFFSHTIKKQLHNRKLLQACLAKNIDLYDHETIVDGNNKRLIGFGKYAGMVGAYNAIRAFGLKYDLFSLVKAETLADQNALIERMRRPMLPNIKIVLTGHGKVGHGVKEMLDGMKIKEVTVQDYLAKNYDRPVYTNIDIEDYNKRIDGNPFDKLDFYSNPALYTSNFERFTKVSDIFIAGHFYGNGAPVILTQEMLKAANNKIKVVADISCDVQGPIACTLRASTIADPLYGYYPLEDKEVDYMHPAAIVVMAVDNLPCELPKDASEGFGEMFLEYVIPAFYNNDKDGVLERALITHQGKLTSRFEYLQEYVDGK
jgi:alanine dehydrogenase